MNTLRDRQIHQLNALLSLNSTPSGSSSSSGPAASSTSSLVANGNALPTWKVLVMDKVAQDVLATSLRVQDLRDQGVTLHMSGSNSPVGGPPPPPPRLE